MDRSVSPSDSGGGTPPSEALAIQIAQATAHLKSALAIVDGLLSDTGTGSPEQYVYHLGEASRSIHHAVLALTECDPAT